MNTKQDRFIICRIFDTIGISLLERFEELRLCDRPRIARWPVIGLPPLRENEVKYYLIGWGYGRTVMPCPSL
jgi:hypothetical protein